MPPSPFEGEEKSSDVPTFAIVTRVKGKFYKPHYEALALAQPAPWKTLLLWPEGLESEHPADSIVPQAPNLEVRYVPGPRLYRKGKAPVFLPGSAVWLTLKKHNVKVILIHEYSPYTLQALVFACAHGIPLLASSEIGRGNSHFFGPRVRAWHAFWSRWPSGIVACCPAAHEPLSGRRLPTFSAYHAVDSRVYVLLGREKDAAAPVVFAYLGQLIPRKGIDFLLQAAAGLKARGQENFRVRLIGGGDEIWVRRMVRDLDLEKHVEITGFLSGAAIQEALGSADAFVFPTREDTYAVVVHEAACLGLPLLVSRHAGAAEALVEEGKNGFIIDPANTETFVDRLCRLLDPDIRRPMGERSRQIGEAHSAHLRGKALWEWITRTFLEGAPEHCLSSRSK